MNLIAEVLKQALQGDVVCLALSVQVLTVIITMIVMMTMWILDKLND